MDKRKLSGIPDDAITVGICQVYAKLHKENVDIDPTDRYLIRKYVKGACYSW